jgi:hypothetical protein
MQTVCTEWKRPAKQGTGTGAGAGTGTGTTHSAAVQARERPTGHSTRETWVAGVFRLATQWKRDQFRGAAHAVTLATCP